MKIARPFALAVAGLLSFAPALLFGYLGTFSRLWADDYGYVGKPLETGTWQALLFWRETWTGEYSNHALIGLLSPLGAALPAVFPLIIIGVGLLGMAALVAQVLPRPAPPWRYIAALALGALVLGAGINGMHSAESFFWLSASVEYTLPCMTLALAIALGLRVARQPRSPAFQIAAGVAAFFFGLINAGFSEMFLLFQCLFLAAGIVCSRAFAGERQRRVCLVMAGAAFMGALTGLAIQISAPGWQNHMALTWFQGRPIAPLRHPPALVEATVQSTLAHLGHDRAFAGFMLLLAAGLRFSLSTSRATPDRRDRVPLATGALWLCLSLQLLLLPALWAHESDEPALLGRFSPAFFAVVCLNLLLLAGSFGLLLRRRRVERILNGEQGILHYCGALLLAALACFALTQVRSIHHLAGAYLWLTCMALLGMASWQLRRALSKAARQRSGLLLLRAWPLLIIAALSLAALTAVSLWAQGFVVGRVWAFFAFLLALSGLLWGLSLGEMARSCFGSTPGAAWLKRGKVGSLSLALILGLGICIGNFARLDPLSTSARLWDEQDAETRRLIEAGDPAVYSRYFVSRFIRYDDTILAAPLPAPMHAGMRLFYGLDYDSITP